MRGHRVVQPMCWDRARARVGLHGAGAVRVPTRARRVCEWSRGAGAGCGRSARAGAGASAGTRRGYGVCAGAGVCRVRVRRVQGAAGGAGRARRRQRRPRLCARRCAARSWRGQSEQISRALAARRSPARPPPGAASRGVSRARARVAAVPASGSRSRRRPSAAERTPSPIAAAMATTVTCTRFTDEYQLYEDIGK